MTRTDHTDAKNLTSLHAASDCELGAARAGATGEERRQLFLRRAKGHARTALASALVLALAFGLTPGALALAGIDTAPSGQDSSARGSSAPSGADSSASTEDSASAATYEKTEVVYATLGADGTPEACYVVNQFDVEDGGLVEDAGEYESVKCLNQELDLRQDGDVVSFDAQPGTFYYEGDLPTSGLELPWNVGIDYTLDGRSVSAEELGGAAGEVGVHVSTERNASADPAFAESYMLQITFTLDGNACSDIQAEGATIASAGTDRTVAFTVLPGKDASFDLTMHAEGFSMAGAQITALPYANVVEMPDVSGVEGELSQLTDAVAQLADGTSQLASGIEELGGGADSLADGAASFGSGLDQLDGSSASLVAASGQIESALASVSAGLANADLGKLDDLEQLPTALGQLADGLSQLSSAASTVQQGYSSALSSLDSAIDGLVATAPSQEDIAALQAAVAGTDQAATVDALLGVYAAAQQVQATFDAVEPAFAGADETLAATASGLSQQTAALQGMADSLSASLGGGSLDQLGQLAAGLDELSSQYGQFHEGLESYAAGISTLADNYASLNSGARQLADGVGQTADGAGELSEGATVLDSFTADLPAQMRSRIDELMADYDFPEFKPRSFVSSENAHTSAVQFVMSTPAIEAPAPAEEGKAPEESEPTLWDRFTALFE